MDEHTYKSVPDISEEFPRYRARKRQLDQIRHTKHTDTDVQPASGIPAFVLYLQFLPSWPPSFVDSCLTLHKDCTQSIFY